MKKLTYFIFSLALIPVTSLANATDDEIDFLIDSVGRGGCTFVRNESRFTGRDAREYLRSKFRRNAHLVNSTEEFIQKIASESVTSGEPYLISCRGQQEQTANEWLTSLLLLQRSSES